MSLQDEIKERSNQIFRESYQMSIGELINLYKDGEMDVHPEFQRLFRWSNLQRTKLIESLMLNIPIPPIFVSQSENGVWDIIDGVQRLSTIFQFVGVLKDQNGSSVSPLILSKTEYIPSFAGVMWENRENPVLSFTKEQQLYFKRSRIDVNIVKKESDPNAKYELFQRLNTGGSFLSDQEVRNCLMIMANKGFYEFIEELSKTQSFVNTTPISDSRADEQYRMELVTRLIISMYIDWTIINKYSDFAELLDKEVLVLCNSTLDYGEIKRRFSSCFDLIYGVVNEDAFRKFNGSKHLGPFLASAFQTISYGVMKNFDAIIAMGDHSTWLQNKIENLYNEPEFIRNTTPGVRSIPRYRDLSIFGEVHFKP